MPANDKGVGSDRGLDYKEIRFHMTSTTQHTLRGRKVDDMPILLEHVHLLNPRDRLGIDLLQGISNLGLLPSRRLAALLDLSTDSALPTDAGL